MKFSFLRIFVLSSVFACLTATAETAQDVINARRIDREALAARKDSNDVQYLTLAREAFQLRPNMPGARLRLAGAFARNGQADDALAQLEKIAAQGLAFDLARQADFAALKELPRFQAIIESMAANVRPVVASSVAFELAEKDFLSEGIAYDEKTRDFFVASVYQRKIVRRLASGAVKPFAAKSAGEMWSVVALAVDSTRRHLWATTAAMDQTRNVEAKDIGRTAILKFDLDRELLLARYELPDQAVKRVFGDLLIAENGDAFVSESLEGGIYRVADGKLSPFIAPGTFVSPQGMAWVGKILYVADYSLGLLRVDTNTHAVEWLKLPSDACLLGLDGMVRIGNALIATQNGVNPHRVVKIALDASGHIARVTPLEVNHPRYNEPTLGVAVGSDFFYVANSQWELFEPGKMPPLEKLVAPVILRLPISVTSIK